MTPVLALLWLLQSFASMSPPDHVRLIEYDLYVPATPGWSRQTTDTAGVVLERDGAFVTLDWYAPRNHRQYKDFDRRVQAEIRDRESDYGTVHTRRYHIGVLRAVEVRFLDKKHNIFVETFLGVPDGESRGELFVITLEARPGAAGASDLNAYHRLIRALRVIPHSDS